MGKIRGETQEDAARVQSPAPAGTSISTKTPSPACRTGPSQRDLAAAAQGGDGDHHSTHEGADDQALSLSSAVTCVCV